MLRSTAISRTAQTADNHPDLNNQPCPIFSRFVAQLINPYEEDFRFPGTGYDDAPSRCR
jgi:hypothetical protein